MARIVCVLGLLLLHGCCAVSLSLRAPRSAHSQPTSDDPTEEVMSLEEIEGEVREIREMEKSMLLSAPPEKKSRMPTHSLEESSSLEERKSWVLDQYPSAFPGCFMRLPSGCPNYPKKSHLWRHDVWAEQEVNLTASQCKMRKHYWDEYCGTTDAKTVHIAPHEEDNRMSAHSLEESNSFEEKKSLVFDQYPSTFPGCFMRLPSGCPNNPKKSHLWRHDAWAEQEANLTASQCKMRKHYWDEYCGTTDAKTVHIAPHEEENRMSAHSLEESNSFEEKKSLVFDQYPSTFPGCFMRLPSGCPNNPKKSHLWRHDAWAEQEANLTASQCKMRKHYWDDYCGTTDAKVVYIAPPEEEKK